MIESDSMYECAVEGYGRTARGGLGRTSQTEPMKICREPKGQLVVILHWFSLVAWSVLLAAPTSYVNAALPVNPFGLLDLVPGYYE